MCELTLKCYAKLQQTNVEVFVFFLRENIISCELSALIKFYLFLSEK